MERALARALAVLVPHLDIADERVVVGAAPSWCARRGWDAFLASLTDAELARCERGELAACLAARCDTPPDLVALARAVGDALGLIEDAPAPNAGTDTAARRPCVSDRKQRQIDALLARCRPVAERARRIVDLGAGSGHLTRCAAGTLDVPGLGVERDRARARRAAALAAGAREERVRFEVRDVVDDPPDVGADDLVFGLHACGELGDALIELAARRRARVAFVSCCLQKIRAAVRAPRSEAAARGGLVLSRAALGLSNLAAREEGVEVSLEATLRARETRCALLLLLRQRGFDVGWGDEMRGINRRRARHGLAELAARALALRSAPPASASELADAERAGGVEYARIRRLSLPRALLAPIVELAVALDRAAYLEARGYDAAVVRAFPAATSPRNLAIFAAPASAHLAPTQRDAV